MVKKVSSKKSWRLFGLLVLVAVAAGVAFLEPQLIGYAIHSKGASLLARTYLYPVNVSAVSGFANVSASGWPA
ncbi:hypothetical protein HY571_02375, partial [Candidatus Micrarchaeota archaeon]|nr:hypothetical protein [Candidatus Micrarchaeota archaeon]